MIITWGLKMNDHLAIQLFYSENCSTTLYYQGFGRKSPYDITRREINGKVVKALLCQEDIFIHARKKLEISFTVWKKYQRGCLIRKDFAFLH